MSSGSYKVIVIGGGHAGVEAAWAAANLLPGKHTVALVTLDPGKIGVMSCNPAIGGLAKGQIVREIDALGGLMGLAADAAGIQFKVLNTSKGPAVHGPRAQCDKHVYAEVVQGLIASREEIHVIAGAVERFAIEGGRLRGAVVSCAGQERFVGTPAIVLTTGTFMRGLMHTGEMRTPGGRHGEAAAGGISRTLAGLGFELGRLKTGTPPRLRMGSIDWESLTPEPGDERPVPFSDLSRYETSTLFPAMSQVECRRTATTGAIHDHIRANLHRAPMYSGQIESAGPRYCPSIEDKVVRFADRSEHGVFLEPESLRDDWVYCNGISTSLPPDVQEKIVRGMPGCERAEIYRYGYAVEYDMVRPHQIEATCMTRLVPGLFLAGQINGTSGYEEAAGQGLVAGVNAVKWSGGSVSGAGDGYDSEPFVLGRHEAYIGVLLDDLVTRTPTEPYRMFTSRAEYRLLLRADNAPERLTPRAIGLGLLDSGEHGGRRLAYFRERSAQIEELRARIGAARLGNEPLAKAAARVSFTAADLVGIVGGGFRPEVIATVLADHRYEAYVARELGRIERAKELETKRISPAVDYTLMTDLRAEAREALTRFRPTTFGQAGRLEGVTPTDVTLLAVLIKRQLSAQDA